MGHCIAAFRSLPAIASLSKASWNTTNYRIYELLNCEDLNCGCSGCGGYREFSIDDIKDAYLKACKENFYEEAEFLLKLIDANNNSFLLWFS